MLARTLCLIDAHFIVLQSSLAVTKTYSRGRAISDYVIGLNLIIHLKFQVALLNSSELILQQFSDLLTLTHCQSQGNQLECSLVMSDDHGKMWSSSFAILVFLKLKLIATILQTGLFVQIQKFTEVVVVTALLSLTSF